LTAVVKKISKGRFSEKIPYTNQQSDIDGLAKAIDKMGLNLRLALKRIRSGLSEKPTVNND
jgi:methyl-accepting chemotaxis protein